MQYLCNTSLYGSAEFDCVYCTVQGANLQQKSKEGLTARSLAFDNNHVRIVTLIDNAMRLLQEEEGKLLPLLSLSSNVAYTHTIITAVHTKDPYNVSISSVSNKG